MNCQIFARVHVFELQMIFSYCDITNRSELLMTHLAGCTNQHPPNVSLGGMHQLKSVMMMYDIY